MRVRAESRSYQYTNRDPCDEKTEQRERVLEGAKSPRKGCGADLGALLFILGTRSAFRPLRVANHGKESNTLEAGQPASTFKL